jgi:Short C-terminal domain
VTVGKISAACWVVFVIMSVVFLPLGFAIMSIHALPETTRAVLAVLVILVLWWGPFVYAMYLSLAVMRNGDRRLMKRGVHGTAEVLSVKRTNTVIQEGEFAWEAPRVYKYRLRVHLPGKAPYETDCAVCATGISKGQMVNVAVSPHNKLRVTIDVGQNTKDGSRRPRPVAGDSMVDGSTMAQSFPANATDFSLIRDQQASSETERLNQLAQLGQLHQQGVLTDAEFAAQKAQILGHN